MSFQNNSMWLTNSSGSLANGEMCYDTTTRIDKKRGHQWFTGPSEQELFINKKQAIESIRETAEPITMDGLWHHASSSQSEGQTGDRLFAPKPVRCSNVPDNNNDNNNVPLFNSDPMNMEKKGFHNQIGNNSSTCLTMSRAVEDPLCLNTGLRKVKVNEVTISDNCLPEFMGNTFCPGEQNNLTSTMFQRSGSNMYSGPTYDNGFSKQDRNFISVGQASNNTDANFMLTNQYYNGIDNNLLSIGFNRGNYSTNIVQYEKEASDFVPIGPTYGNRPDNFFTADPFCNRLNETFSNYNNVHQDAPVVSLGSLYSKENSGLLSMVATSKKGEESTISFGGVEDSNDERLINDYDLLLSQSTSQSTVQIGQRDSAEQLTANVVTAAASKTDGAQIKNKEQKTKKGSTNNFPTNVKSLLSTGILDGVPVKYVSWSREKNLRGVVKGTGYLCSCEDCKLLKAINAYEFERHAGCKTKHPNNHIYFENGKTIYAVVQELKSTPQERLFDVMQNVTGSPVDQKNFDTWKSSYKTATRELQRIYGKEETIVPS